MIRSGEHTSISVKMSSSYEEPPPLTLSNKTKMYTSKAAEALAAAQYMSHQRDRRSDNDEIYSMGGNRMSSVPPPPPPPGRPESRRRIKEGNQSSLSARNIRPGFSEYPSAGTEGGASLGSGSAAERRRRRAQEAAKQAEMQFASQFSKSNSTDEKNVVDEEDPPLKLDLSDSGGESSADENDDFKSKKKRGFFKVKNLIRKSVSFCTTSWYQSN